MPDLLKEYSESNLLHKDLTRVRRHLQCRRIKLSNLKFDNYEERHYKCRSTQSTKKEDLT